MNDLGNLINIVSHRPWIMPEGKWAYYQEWNNALFLHWKVPTNELEKLIPKNTSLDTFNGESWISLVAFTMEKIRPRLLPAISSISNFHEINIRTYLKEENKQGVYFLNIEAEKPLSTFVAKILSGLPYENANIVRYNTNGTHKFLSNNTHKNFKVEASFSLGQMRTTKSELDNWLTERYCLYLDKNKNLYRYEIHHEPWNLFEVKILKLFTQYKIGNISLNRSPDLVHYSNGVKVVAWNKDIITKNI